MRLTRKVEGVLATTAVGLKRDYALRNLSRNRSNDRLSASSF